jgi:hypothetical protein
MRWTQLIRPTTRMASPVTRRSRPLWTAFRLGNRHQLRHSRRWQRRYRQRWHRRRPAAALLVGGASVDAPGEGAARGEAAAPERLHRGHRLRRETRARWVPGPPARDVCVGRSARHRDLVGDASERVAYGSDEGRRARGARPVARRTPRAPAVGSAPLGGRPRQRGRPARPRRRRARRRRCRPLTSASAVMAPPSAKTTLPTMRCSTSCARTRQSVSLGGALATMGPRWSSQACKLHRASPLAARRRSFAEGSAWPSSAARQCLLCDHLGPTAFTTPTFASCGRPPL